LRNSFADVENSIHLGPSLNCLLTVKSELTNT
jgi:hypothetical protein